MKRITKYIALSLVCIMLINTTTVFAQSSNVDSES